MLNMKMTMVTMVMAVMIMVTIMMMMMLATFNMTMRTVPVLIPRLPAPGVRRAGPAVLQQPGRLPQDTPDRSHSSQMVPGGRGGAPAAGVGHNPPYGTQYQVDSRQ